MGYGFRYVKFKRENFTILRIITIRETVPEAVEIHYLNGGLALEYAPTDRLSFSGSASVGHVLYNQADNSLLGTVRGHGGTLGSFGVTAQYAVGTSWQLGLGAFTEVQRLAGGEKEQVVWPDNHLNMYGGTLNLRFQF